MEDKTRPIRNNLAVEIWGLLPLWTYVRCHNHLIIALLRICVSPSSRSFLHRGVVVADQALQLFVFVFLAPSLAASCTRFVSNRSLSCSGSRCSHSLPFFSWDSVTKHSPLVEQIAVLSPPFFFGFHRRLLFAIFALAALAQPGLDCSPHLSFSLGLFCLDFEQ